MWERLPTKTRTNYAPITEVVTGILENYAQRAVFRGFSAHPQRGGKVTYKLLWHHDRPFELLLNIPKKTLHFPVLLPGVPSRSQMYRELRAFIRERQSEEIPEHRRVDPAKARMALANSRGLVSLTFTVRKGDFDYATRKIIHIVHEVYLVFLLDGPYFEYMVEQLGLDPDRF